jgi:xylan 1,4-beta-xylosidase
MQTIHIPEHPVGQLNDNYRRCVGTGNLSLALHHEYLSALELTQREIGFDYIRGHGILSDGMGLCRSSYWQGDEHAPTPPPNFTYVFRVYDALLERGIRPFVELSFMPKALASGDKTVFYWKGNVTPPADYAAWGSLIEAFVGALVRRYGLAEVRRWPFEVWNEPDLEGFWSGGQDGYFRLYRTTALAVKAVDRELAVGGPATCPGGIHWITPFLAMCKEHATPVDFVSTHSYYAKDYANSGELSYQAMNPTEHSLEQFRDARRRIQESPYPELPLHITEWNSSWSPRCPVHDTAFNAAFLARLLIEGGDIADSFSYWTFSDVFEEDDVPRSVFHGGFGLVAAGAIPKPTFHLFAFMRRLGRTVLHRSDGLIVTQRDDGALALLAYNPTRSDGGGERRLRLDVPVRGNGNVAVTYSVDEERGNAFAAWRKLGRPRHPRNAMLDLLRRAAVPPLDLLTLSRQDGASRGLLDLILPENSVVLAEVPVLDDETPTYYGLDDTRLVGF